MSEENIRSESSEEHPGAERARQPSEQFSKRLIDIILAAGVDCKQTDVSDIYQDAVLRMLSIVGERDTIETKSHTKEAKVSDLSLELPDMPREKIIFLAISASKFKELSDKTAEVLREVALAYERIGKDQQEIEQLKMETRALLAELRAA